jgi:N-acetylglucosamine transport system substrate-binding protein
MRFALPLPLLLLIGILAGCGSGSTTDSVTEYQPDAKLEGEVEVAAFQGGYGIDFYEQAAREFEQQHPDVKINVWGNPRVWEQLRPRFIGNNPPDLAFPGWGMDHYALAEEDQLADLGPALDTPAAEGSGKWRETFNQEALKLAQIDGKQYTLPLYVMLFGWWYDPQVFAKNGWEPPKTYGELLTLAEKIKAAGIAPITFQGKYPYYMIEGMWLPWAHSIGGQDTIRNAQNLEPGAWNSPAMVRAAEMIDDLNKRGFLQKGATAMTHTEAQQEFLQGRAAMVPCGTWLYSEMRNVMPPNAKMEFFLPPVVEGGQGDPSALLIGIEPWMVPSGAKNKNAAIAYYKYMTSPAKAKQFVEEKGTLMAIQGSDEAKLPEVLVTPARFFRESKQLYATQYRQWYPAFQTEIEGAMTSMLNGQLTPKQFCDRVEAEAEKVRTDPNIKKYRL